MRAPEAGRGGHLAGAEEGAQGDGATDGRPDGVHLRARRGTGGGGRSEETARVSQTDRAGGQGNFRVAPRAGGRAGEGFAVANARWRSRRAPRGGPRFPSKPWRSPSSSVRGVRDVLLWRTLRRNQQKKKREPLVGRMCCSAVVDRHHRGPGTSVIPGYARAFSPPRSTRFARLARVFVLRTRLQM
jgi:hypothetical protein